MGEPAKNPPKYPFAICTGEPPNRQPIEPKTLFRVKANAQKEADAMNKDIGSTGYYVVDRIPWEDGMIAQDD